MGQRYYILFFPKAFTADEVEIHQTACLEPDQELSDITITEDDGNTRPRLRARMAFQPRS